MFAFNADGSELWVAWQSRRDVPCSLLPYPAKIQTCWF